MVKVTVDRVNIPPMSTIGYGYGRDEAGNLITFAGDHRPMRYLGEAIASCRTRDELPVVELEIWQVVSIEEAPLVN